MTTYKRTQIGYGMLVALGVLLVVSLAAAGLEIYGTQGMLMRSTGVLLTGLVLLCAVATGSMTVEVRTGAVTWHFGPGASRWSIPLDDVASVALWKSDGWKWGIRETPEGRLYGVGGNRGVRVTLHTGRSIILGTDRPEDLKAAVEAAMKPHAQAGLSRG